MCALSTLLLFLLVVEASAFRPPRRFAMRVAHAAAAGGAQTGMDALPPPLPSTVAAATSPLAVAAVAVVVPPQDAPPTASPRRNASSSSASSRQAPRAVGGAGAGVVDAVLGGGAAAAAAAVAVSLLNEVAQAGTHAGVGRRYQCREKVKRPPSAEGMNCPAECPFVRPDTILVCSFSCVPPEDCGSRNPLTSFPDPVSHMCVACLVPGCDICGSSRHTCARCAEGLVLHTDGDRCVSPYRFLWWCLCTALLLLAILAVNYVVCLWRRPEVNTLALNKAMEHRRSMRLRAGPDGSKVPLLTNLAHNEVAGVGVRLHFSWQRYVMAWSFCMVLLLVMFSFFFGDGGLSIIEDRIDHHNPGDEHVLEACAADGAQYEEESKRFEHYCFGLVVIVYISSAVGAIFLYARHRYVYERGLTQCDRMMDYALLAQGFPPEDGDEKLEEVYTEFFRGTRAFPQVGIVGVSVCWDYWASTFNPTKQVENELDSLARERDGEASRSKQVFRFRSRSFSEQRQCICDPTLRFLDQIFLGCSCCFSASQEKDNSIAKNLRSLRSTGKVYVVFSTEQERDEAFAQARERSPLYAKGDVEYPISLSKPDYEALSVLWKNQGCTNSGWRLVASCGLILVAVLAWAFVFYKPYVDYILSNSKRSGMSQGNFLQMLLLGAVISIGNQIMYFLCDLTASKVGFAIKSHKDLCYVCQYTVAIFINTALDLCTVLLLAYGYHVDESRKVIGGSSVLSMRAIAENTSIRDALYMQMMSYLFPSTLLLPFCFEPIGLGVLPYFVGRWIIRSRKDVSIHDAENIMQGLDYDLSRYGDLTINVSICVIVFFVASHDMWKVFAYLLLSQIVIYTWDQIRVLRVAPRSWFDTNFMDNVAQVFLCFPCALLAACTVWRRYGSSKHDPPDGLAKELHEYLSYEATTRASVCAHMALAFAAHIVLFYCAVHYLVPRLLKYFPHPSSVEASFELEYSERWMDILKTKLYARNFTMEKAQCVGGKVVDSSGAGLPHFFSRRDLADAVSAEHFPLQVLLPQAAGGTHSEFRGQPYEVTAKRIPCNWFNANAVHCLRSKYIYRHEPFCVPFKAGRQDLLMSNPKLGQYFTGEPLRPETPRSDGLTNEFRRVFSRR